MNYSPNEFIDEIVETSINKLKLVANEIATNTAYKVLGVNINSFGDITSIDDNLYKKIVKNEGVDNSINEFEKDVANLIKIKLTSTKFKNSVVKQFEYKIFKKIDSIIFETVESTIESMVKDLVISHMKQHPALSSFFVAEALEKANG
jgi:hypothetical protein